MPTLSDKLKSLGVKIGAQELPSPPPRRSHAIEEVVSGRLQATPHGEAFVVETTYSSEYRHGQLGLAVSASLKTIADWAREARLVECPADALLFLDTETTGLAGGTGTLAFLIGIGHLAGEEFRLTQFFLRDPVEEPAVLAALAEFVQGSGALVTFNGKGFDVPLLNARYITNGYATPLAGAAHLDLLPLARRLWRERLESRALGALETHILGAERSEEDIPSWLIPQMYFDYLRSGDARPLKRVLYHNAMDVLAMAALLNHITRMFADPIRYAAACALDLIALGRLYEDLGRLEEAVQLYEQGLAGDLQPEAFRRATQRLAFLQRRRGALQAALDLWRSAAGAKEVYAFIELAKHYEHRVKDYAQAAQWTREALAIVTARDFPMQARRHWQGELEHRLKRLEQRVTRRRRPAG